MEEEKTTETGTTETFARVPYDGEGTNRLTQKYSKTNDDMIDKYFILGMKDQPNVALRSDIWAYVVVGFQLFAMFHKHGEYKSLAHKHGEYSSLLQYVTSKKVFNLDRFKDSLNRKYPLLHFGAKAISRHNIAAIRGVLCLFYSKYHKLVTENQGLLSFPTLRSVRMVVSMDSGRFWKKSCTIARNRK